jgi:hypothetical protein
MKRKYSIAEARVSLAAIIQRAEAGHEIELTRRGKPVAAAYRSFLDKHAGAGRSVSL